MRLTIISAFISLLALATTLTATPCAADVVVVPPGVGTLQTAIDAASPGDQLRLQSGVYTGAVVVNKELKILCYADEVGDSCVIDANCAAPVALDITADKVAVATKTGSVIMRVIRGTDTELRVANSNKVRLYQLQLDTAFEAPCGTEATGLEVSASSNVKIGYVHTGHGVYLHEIATGAHVSIGKLSTLFNGDELSEPSVLIEDSGIGAPLGKSGIQISNNYIQTATDGAAPDEVAIQLVNSDGVRIKGNVVSTGGAGATGIVLDASSDANLILKNRWAGASPNTPYVDNGAGNCAKGNFSDPDSVPFPNTCP